MDMAQDIQREKIVCTEEKALDDARNFSVNNKSIQNDLTRLYLLRYLHLKWYQFFKTPGIELEFLQTFKLIKLIVDNVFRKKKCKSHKPVKRCQMKEPPTHQDNFWS